MASKRTLNTKNLEALGAAALAVGVREPGSGPVRNPPQRFMVSDLLALPLEQRLGLGQTLWDSIASEQISPERTDTDTLTVELADRVSSSSEVVSDSLIVDTGVQGKLVGVTLEHYSQISDSSTIETLLPITPLLQPA